MRIVVRAIVAMHRANVNGAIIAGAIAARSIVARVIITGAIVYGAIDIGVTFAWAIVAEQISLLQEKMFSEQ